MNHSFDFFNEFNDILDEYSEEIEIKLKNGVHEASENLEKKYESYALQKGWTNYGKSFVIKSYSGRSKTQKNGFYITDYVGNSAKTEDNLPLINLLTYGATRKNRGIMQPDNHIKRIHDTTEEESLQIIIKNLEK